MSIIAWMLLGVLSGLIASPIVNGKAQWLLMDMILGILGAFAGGLMFHLASQTGFDDVNIRTVFGSVLGAGIIIVAFHALSRRGARP
jgi:uncharacterized membrane protein YeaQ/YmgE (transglycosylase-associated protein family)